MIKGDIELLFVNKTDKLDVKSEEQSKETTLKFKGTINDKDVKIDIKLETNHVDQVLADLNLFKTHSTATLIIKRWEQTKLDPILNDQKPLKDIVGSEDAQEIVKNNQTPAQEEPEEEIEENSEATTVTKVTENVAVEETPKTIEVILDPNGEYKGYESKEAYERAELAKLLEEKEKATKKGKARKKRGA